MVIPYVVGIDAAETPSAGDSTVITPADSAAPGGGLHHAVARHALADGSEVAVALCGLTVRVWREAEFPGVDGNSDAADPVCQNLVAAALRAASGDAAPR
jgi:hypothetical protein